MIKRLIQRTGPWEQGEDIILESPHPDEYIVGLGFQIPKSSRFAGSVVLDSSHKKNTHPSPQLGIFIEGQPNTVSPYFLIANRDAVQFDNLNVHRIRVRALQPLPTNAIIDIIYESRE